MPRILLIATFFVVGLFSVLGCNDYPTFLWAGKEHYLGAPNQYNGDSKTNKDIVQLLTGITKMHDAPEVILIMTTDKSPTSADLGLDRESSMPSLHQIVVDSPSSLVLPCVLMHSSKLSVEVETDHHLENFAHRVHGDLAEWAKSNEDKFDNGKIDVLIYHPRDYNSVSDLDGLVKEATSLIESRVGRRYVIVHKAEEKVAFNGKEFISVNRLLQDENEDTTESSRFVRMTPNTLAAILTTIFFFVIIFIAASQMAALKTPSLYVDKPLPHGKVQY